MPDVGLEMERILAPIVVHGDIYGFMWIIADEHGLTEIDMMAIEIGTTIAALMMLYQETVQSAEANLSTPIIARFPAPRALLAGSGICPPESDQSLLSWAASPTGRPCATRLRR
jgi:hypothetical protein